MSKMKNHMLSCDDSKCDVCHPNRDSVIDIISELTKIVDKNLDTLIALELRVRALEVKC